jgi:hypothetical protein
MESRKQHLLSISALSDLALEPQVLVAPLLTRVDLGPGLVQERHWHI